MGRPEFTAPVERPSDAAARSDNVEEYSTGGGTTINQNTDYSEIVVNPKIGGNNLGSAPIFIESASLNYRGGLAPGADVQWRFEAEDSNNNQIWLKHGGSGGDGGYVPLPGLKLNDGQFAIIEVRNQSGGSITVDASFTYRTE
jgi:hypothetical protein